MKKIYEIAINAAIQAGKEVHKIYDFPNLKVDIKKDNSPLTKADQISNNVINDFLSKTSFPIISEENKQLDYDKRKKWDTVWIIDPLDGTKEFIKKNNEFTVNIALCSFGKPVFGAIYAPVLKVLYYAVTSEKKAYKTILDDSFNLKGSLFDKVDLISPKHPSEDHISIVCSRSHMNEETSQFITEMRSKFSDLTLVSKGSSLKFCIVAEGGAHVYPRFAPTMEWDTAAGHAICTAVGLKVISKTTNLELSYNKKNLSNPHFIVEN